MARHLSRWLADQMLRALPTGPAKVRLHTGPPPSVPTLLAPPLSKPRADVSPLPDPPMPSTPWADPGHDVLADIRETMQQAATARAPHNVLHCAQDVADALTRYALDAPAWLPVAVGRALFGLDVAAHRDWEPGRWELRSDGEVIDSGRLEDL